MSFMDKRDLNNSLTLSFLSEKGLFKVMETTSLLLEQGLEELYSSVGLILNYLEFKFKLKSNNQTYVQHDLNLIASAIGNEGRLYLEVAFPEEDFDFSRDPMIVRLELNDLNDVGLGIIGSKLTNCGVEMLCYDKIRQKINFLTEGVNIPKISSSIDD